MIPLHSHQLWQAIVDSTTNTGEGRALCAETETDTIVSKRLFI